MIYIPFSNFGNQPLNVNLCFSYRCNLESVELCQLDAKDKVFVKELLEDFSEKTGSEIAQAILDDFENLGKKLTKVFPTEYQRHSIYIRTLSC